MKFRKQLKNKSIKIEKISNLYSKVTGDVMDVYEFYMNYFGMDGSLTIHFLNKEKLNESIRDQMKPKPLEDIKKSLEKTKPHNLLGKLDDMCMKLQDIFTEEEILELEPYLLLDYSFNNNYIKGIKYVLDNYRLYGKETSDTISTHITDIKNNDDLAYLLKNKQITKFLTDEQKYVLEKFRLGMHQSETKEYEKNLIKQLDNTDYHQSKSNPSVMIGTNKKRDKNYFNYNKDTQLLTRHLDNLSSWLTGVDDEDNYESHRGDRMVINNEYDLHYRYLNLIIKGTIGKYYGIEIDKVNGSRNDGHSFVKE